MNESCGITLVPGVYDTLTALAAWRSGYHTLFLSGAALHATALGRPDVGLLTATELAHCVSRIRERVDARLIVDGDTGYGGTHNLCRTVRTIEEAGGDVIQIEDQIPIRQPGRLHERTVVSALEMIDRIKAAVDARRSPSLLVSARTDAMSTLGLEEALERASRYAEAGADLLFVQSVADQEQADLVASHLAGTVPLGIHLPDILDRSGFDLDRLALGGFQYGLQPSLLINASFAAIADKLGSATSIPRASSLSEYLDY